MPAGPSTPTLAILPHPDQYPQTLDGLKAATAAYLEHAVGQLNPLDALDYLDWLVAHLNTYVSPAPGETPDDETQEIEIVPLSLAEIDLDTE